MPQPQERVLTVCPERQADLRLALARQTLQTAGHLRIRAFGSSMLPAILPGDLLTFRAATPADAAPGRIVLAATGDSAWRVHRIAALDGDWVVTRGDALRHRDPPLPCASLLGVLEAQQRGERILAIDRSPNRLLPSTTRWLLRHLPLAHRLARITARRCPRLIELAA
ncbi:MAG: S24/S26 family peptidase [Xanthomonadales bacterium]|nr:S24/S26 family peptidase [Xanthomonadales bacterium]